ncbi:hypothetical protein F4778DRAFT_429298 [Xylariomycetidae sp. FL2044]|nr:hypothetical protein F4778DRAFT_429298 [Xylariomycetidae sp. FL2044]
MDPAVDPSTLPHDNKIGTLLGVEALLMSITTLFVASRVYCRFFLIKQAGPDDYMVLVALALVYCTGITQCVHVRDGLGRHIWDLTGPQQIINYFRTFYISIVFYNAGLLFVKMTFLLQYYRVFAVNKLRVVAIAAIVVIGCWSTSQVLVGIFICTPIAGFWDTTIPAKCIPNFPQFYINAGGNIITDVFIFFLPLPVLRSLNLPKTQRLFLIGIFSLGFFTCAISVIRIKYLKQGDDPSYENVEASIWSITELCSGVICSCMPTLRPIAVEWVPRLRTKLQKSGYGYKKQSGSKGTSDTNDVELGNNLGTKGSKRTPHWGGMGSKDDLYQSTDSALDGRESTAPSARTEESGRVGSTSTQGDTIEEPAATYHRTTTTRTPIGRFPSRGSIKVQREVIIEREPNNP